MQVLVFCCSGGRKEIGYFLSRSEKQGWLMCSRMDGRFGSNSKNSLGIFFNSECILEYFLFQWWLLM